MERIATTQTRSNRFQPCWFATRLRPRLTETMTTVPCTDLIACRFERFWNVKLTLCGGNKVKTFREDPKKRVLVFYCFRLETTMTAHLVSHFVGFVREQNREKNAERRIRSHFLSCPNRGCVTETVLPNRPFAPKPGHTFGIRPGNRLDDCANPPSYPPCVNVFLTRFSHLFLNSSESNAIPRINENHASPRWKTVGGLLVLRIFSLSTKTLINIKTDSE